MRVAFLIADLAIVAIVAGALYSSYKLGKKENKKGVKKHAKK